MKRSLDVLVAVIGLIVLSPLLGLIALSIKADSSGPVVFRQTRLGRHGSCFRILKFRTMVQDADNHHLGIRTAESDPRITRVGKVLRKFSLDEIPQLVNILRGEMSLVGPRPAPKSHLEWYTGRQRRRLDVRPGITGWAQVNGRNSLTWPQRIEFDVWYVENWSHLLDFQIAVRTLITVVRRDGVYSGRNEPSSS